MARIAIVTGGASGIGLALGRALVARGAHVVLADIDAEAADAAAKTLDDEGPGSATSNHVDVADAAAVAGLVTTTHAEHGRLDLLFNNAGIGGGGEPEELELAHWDRTIDVNLRGVVHGCHAAYPLMLEQGFGHIVNTASLGGLVGGLALIAPYATAKHGVVGLSLALRVAGARTGVRVHVVCPGFVDTPILDKIEIAGLPTPPSMQGVSGRELARESALGRFYPADRLAQDVLRGIARDRAIIVAPMSARIVWRLWRLAPELMLRLSTRETDRLRTKVRHGRIG